MTKYLCMIMAVVLGSCFFSGNVLGQEEDVFSTKLSLGATLTDGNSETMQANFSLITEGEKDGFGSIRAGLEANYGETTTKSIDEMGIVDENTDKTIENIRVFGGLKKTISKNTFGAIDGSVLYDNIAKVDYRATIAPGIGIYLINKDAASMSVEVGTSYIWEEVSSVKDDYLAVKFNERFDYSFSKFAKVWQVVEYLPKADDFSDYLLNIELGAEAALSSSLNLRLVLQNKHDSTPGADLEKNDVVLIGGISFWL